MVVDENGEKIFYKDSQAIKASDLEEIRKNQGWFFALGIALVALGALALGSSVFTTFASIIFFGWLLLIGGLIQAIHALWTRSWSSFFLNLMLGILNFVAGGIMISKPAVGVLSLTLLLAAFFVAGGLVRIITSLVMRPHQWGWLLLNGIITLILGILIGAEWPLSSLWVIGLFVGIDLILAGWSFIALALEARGILHHPNITHTTTT